MAPSKSQTSQDFAVTAEVDTYLQAHYEIERFMGTAIVARNGKTIFAKGYGMV